MPVLERSELEQSPLADLHAIASEIGIEGYRRLRRDDLIEALLTGEAPSSEPTSGDDEDSDDDRPKRRSRGGRGRGRGAQREEREDREDREVKDERPARGGRGGGGGGGGRGRGARAEARDETADRDARGERDDRDDEADAEPRTGVLDILPNGSGFMRVELFHHSNDDVYVSPAQIRRCELRAGDQLSWSVPPPRRSERHPSLVRVDKVNEGEPEPPAERPKFEDLTPVFAKQKLSGLSDVPYGRGSRVAIGGPPGAGVTSLLRSAVDALKAESDIDLVVLLIGARPEEVTEWQRLDGVSVAGGAFDRAVDEQAQIAELAVERAK